jgi:uncharacterized YceG family protein
MFGKRADETRTAEDRARAAAQRAARRAGRPLPPEAFQDAVPPPDLQDFERPDTGQHTVEYEPTFDTGEHEVPEPVGEEPRVRRIPRENAPRRDDPARGDDTVAPAGDDVSTPDDGTGAPPATAEHETIHEPTAEHELEPAAVAVSDPPRRRPAPPTPRKRATPPPPGGPRRGRAGYWARRAFGLVALAVIVLALYAINATFQPFHGGGSGSVQVTIPSGADAGKIGDILEQAGVVDSSTFFQVNATVTGRRGKLHSGTYMLEKGMANGDAIDALTKGPKGAKVVKTFKLTITEGPSRRENAAAIDKSAVQGDYLKATAAKSVLQRIRSLGAPKGTRTAEGFLFPATYTLTSGATASKLVSEQLDAFKQNFAGVSMKYARSKHLTRYDVLIIASMIEREVEVPRERPLVAAVIYNRLRKGMPLAIDATIRYYLGDWTHSLRVSQLNQNEPYNSRLHRGLPPTPIGNPGLASIKAAAHPARVSYLYYVRKPGKSGEHAFSSTDAKFEQDVAKYNASRGK